MVSPASRSLVTKAWLLAGLASIAALGVAQPAYADEKQACIAASERAQQLKNAGKLGEAREQLMVCGRAECPKLIQQDCTQWMSELLSTLPSVVPSAKDRRGRDILDVRVAVDGKVVTDRLDGKAIVLDPGVHTFRFEAKGAPAVEEQVVVKPGEKNRIVNITFAVGEDAAAGGGPVTGSPPAGDSSSSPPIAAYVVGGLGLVALGAALFVDLGANSDARKLRDTCAPTCPKSDVDDVQSKYTIAGVTAGIGGALVITGVVLFILHGKGDSSKSAAKAPVLAVHPGLSGRGRGPETAALFRF